MSAEPEILVNTAAAAPAGEPDRWYLLLHQIPPQPGYFRARILRQLNQLGALPIKKSAYIFPATADSLEDLQWLRRDIAENGGDAWLFACTTVAGHTDESLREAFQRLHEPDYELLRAELQELLAQAQPDADPQSDLITRARRVKKSLDAISRIDFFPSAQAKEVHALMNTLEHTLAAPADASHSPRTPANEYHNRRWVTRKGVKVDRMASAWLIQRFIDPAPLFHFVDPAAYTHQSGDLRFDMFDGEFTHEGGLCTFEVLAEKFALAGEPLDRIAAIVHDLDLKDNRYDRPETPGIAAVIEGIIAHVPDDASRLEEGRRIFDALHEGPA